MTEFVFEFVKTKIYIINSVLPRGDLQLKPSSNISAA